MLLVMFIGKRVIFMQVRNVLKAHFSTIQMIKKYCAIFLWLYDKSQKQKSKSENKTTPIASNSPAKLLDLILKTLSHGVSILI